MVQLAGSLTQFVTSDEMGGLESEMQYSRRGGFFVSKHKGILLALLAAGLAAAVGVAVFYFAPCRQSKTSVAVDKDFEIPLDLKSTRIPDAIRPSYYRLKLHPLIEEPWTFNGTVWITISTRTPLKKIVLNAKGYNITESEVRLTTLKILPSLQGLSQTLEDNSTSEETIIEETTVAATAIQETAVSPTPPTAETIIEYALGINRQEQVPLDEQHIFYLDENLEPNRTYILMIPFAGPFEESVLGFYKSNYHMDGQPTWFAATQFYPTFARFAFPCFDEPGFKAEFEISIARKMHMTAVSNMPIRESEPFGDGWSWDHFQKSPPMSTYLVSYMISEMSNIPVATSKPSIGIWSRPILKSLTPYASSIMPKLLKKYNKYFGSNYPLPKLDLVGNPSETEGSVEYWGMIVFKESSLLLNREKSEPVDNLKAVKTMSHEVAHMWFGNLVTMEWWSEFWLNKGFATFMEFVGADHVEPQWNFLDQFLIKINKVMTQDSLSVSRPIVNEQDESHPLSSMFNSNSFIKASALIRMLNYTLTEPVFLSGIQSFINRLKFETATKEDLWNSFTETANSNSSAFLDGLSVKDIMETWIKQKGYPVVNVTVVYSTGNAVLTQEHFTLDLATKDQSLLWDIPLSYTSSEEEHKWTAAPKSWMKKSEVSLENVVTPEKNDSWVIFNDLKTGFYRVNYDNSTWHRIINLLNTSHSLLPVATRSQLIDDAFSLAEAGYLPYETAFSVSSYLKNERSQVPWTTAMECLRNIEINFRANIEYEVLEEYIIKIMSEIYDVVIAETPSIDNIDYSLLKTDLTMWLCSLDHEGCVKTALDLFGKWKQSNNPGDNNPISGPFKAAYYCTAVRRGGKAEWDFVWSRAKETPHLAEKETLIEGLTCTTQPWLIIKLLEKTLNGEIEIQYAKMVWTNLRSSMAVSVGFDFLRDNWKRIWHRFSMKVGLLKKVVSFLSNLSIETKYQELLDFVSKHHHSMKPISDTMSSILDMIKFRIEWKKRYIPTIANWINSTRT